MNCIRNFSCIFLFNTFNTNEKSIVKTKTIITLYAFHISVFFARKKGTREPLTMLIDFRLIIVVRSDI